MTYNPLISIIIHNYNYGRFLRQCLESVAEQTYQNIEIMISDNDSDDDSWKIILEFDKKYPGKFSIAKNRRNLGPYKNFRVWASNINGDFWFNLCSDDYIEKFFLERAVRAFEAHPKSSYLMSHRSIIDQDECEIFEAPFFDRDCVLYPPGLSLLYMRAVVVASNSQMIYRVNKTPFNDEGPTGSRGIFRSYFGARFTDFLSSIDGAMIYFKQPYVKNRVHTENHGRYVEQHLLDIIGAYGLAHEFREIAIEKLPEHAEKFEAELAPSIEKHANTALRYAVRFLQAGNNTLAKRYVYLAIALNPELDSTSFVKQILGALSSDCKGIQENFLREVKSMDNFLYRSVSYEPTEPYTPLELD
ncbi:glycosyltransferase [Alphaproteobacteria bacterium]|nr:glycosyltransferase [Alphaproteobacteria bacterium]MDC1120285.1 glycosyltransferase [Alphaproteobacteria bacterium]